MTTPVDVIRRWAADEIRARGGNPDIPENMIRFLATQMVELIPGYSPGFRQAKPRLPTDINPRQTKIESPETKKS